ncbi:MAG TPA: peroxiredoxin [Candidatus Baltobacteraceae bacterium]|jgi:peroxiredoxin Q/BCP|nr:peroxiredoxin [Candidatus Baltobacteraceae bacterium]
MLDVGDTLPIVTVLDDRGRSRSTREFLGKYLVLYFYPKDDTPGCTSEAHQFRDAGEEFTRAGAEIVGVSRDTVVSHQRFKEKFALPFTLLADVSSELCDAFGVIVEKNMYGKKSMGIARATFLIDPKGKIAHAWPKVKVEGHAREVFTALTGKELSADSNSSACAVPGKN